MNPAHSSHSSFSWEKVGTLLQGQEQDWRDIMVHVLLPDAKPFRVWNNSGRCQSHKTQVLSKTWFLILEWSYFTCSQWRQGLCQCSALDVFYSAGKAGRPAKRGRSTWLPCHGFAVHGCDNAPGNILCQIKVVTLPNYSPYNTGDQHNSTVKNGRTVLILNCFSSSGFLVLQKENKFKNPLLKTTFNITIVLKKTLLQLFWSIRIMDLRTVLSKPLSQPCHDARLPSRSWGFRLGMTLRLLMNKCHPNNH